MSVYYYYWGYDQEKDNFWAFIDDGTKDGESKFEIANTQEVCDYIKSGAMKHIDDFDGVEALMKSRGLIKEDDVVLFREDFSWD